LAPLILNGCGVWQRKIREIFQKTPLSGQVILSIVRIQMTKTPPVLKIKLDSGPPVYQQIADGLRTMLVNGAFQPGDRLPTVRQMAIDLGVNHNTVAEAYRILAEDRWLELKRGRGATVLSRTTPLAKASTRHDFMARLRELTAGAMADGLETKTVTRQLSALAQELQNLRKANP
jgi:GntR family transcriptional regulator